MPPLEMIDTPRTNIFGITFTDPEDERTSTDRQQIFTGENMIIRIEDIPVFYFPYVRRCE